MIKLIAHVDKKNWTIDGEADPSSVDIGIGVRDNNGLGVKFVNVKLGFKFFNSNNDIIQFGNLPPSRVRYIESNEDILAFSVVDQLEPNTKYKIEVWIEDINYSFAGSFEITTPLPAKPYPSWIFDSNYNSWIAPVNPPMKDLPDDKRYSWNEEGQCWDVVKK
jgi:hypothetical protein